MWSFILDGVCSELRLPNVKYLIYNGVAVAQFTLSAVQSYNILCQKQCGTWRFVQSPAWARILSILHRIVRLCHKMVWGLFSLNFFYQSYSSTSVHIFPKLLGFFCFSLNPDQFIAIFVLPSTPVYLQVGIISLFGLCFSELNKPNLEVSLPATCSPSPQPFPVPAALSGC